jgi:hypothetical protein
VDDIDKWSNEDWSKWYRDNWNKVPIEIRKRCLDCLRAEISPQTLSDWKTRYRSREEFVCHFGNGLDVRNLLRRFVPDKELPPLTYPWSLLPHTNWDDYYMGALQELLEVDDA